MIPEMCVFEKGNPSILITKKKEIAPIKMIKNKEKLNAFELQNFFTEGFLTHNSFYDPQLIKSKTSIR